MAAEPEIPNMANSQYQSAEYTKRSIYPGRSIVVRPEGSDGQDHQPTANQQHYAPVRMTATRSQHGDQTCRHDHPQNNAVKRFIREHGPDQQRKHNKQDG